MARIKGSDTGPERLLRHALWTAGLRGWRLHQTALPGKPDIAFLRARLAVFVDGAFWHGHPSRYWQGRTSTYWDTKIARNQARDIRVDQELQSMGWFPLRIWDFEVTRDPALAAARVKAHLDKDETRTRRRAVLEASQS